MILSVDTELDAVNAILGAIGESPVNSIESPTNVDVINAIGILARTSRKFQSKGWIFNITQTYTMNPDYFTQKITWNSSILKLKSLDKTIYSKRGEYLYNFTKQTDIFTEPVTLECVLLIPFEDLPEVARSYITAKAALDFQVRYQGDEALSQSLEIDRRSAWEDFQRYLLDIEQPNMLEREDVFKVMGGRY